MKDQTSWVKPSKKRFKNVNCDGSLVESSYLNKEIQRKKLLIFNEKTASITCNNLKTIHSIKSPTSFNRYKCKFRKENIIPSTLTNNTHSNKNNCCEKKNKKLEIKGKIIKERKDSENNISFNLFYSTNINVTSKRIRNQILINKLQKSIKVSKKIYLLPSKINKNQNCNIEELSSSGKF